MAVSNRLARATGERLASLSFYVEATDDDIVFLIDGSGRERTIYTTPMSYHAVDSQAEALAAGIARLLPRHPAVPSSTQDSQRREEPLSFDESVNLTAIGPKQQTVALGGTHPHLLLFFAGWVGQSSELPKHLAALDSYAVLAQQHGWPPRWR